MKNQKKIIGRCPICGGDVVKTMKGYRCVNNLGDTPTCALNIYGIIANRRMSDDEVALLLQNGEIMLDGFANKEWKSFPAVLKINDRGEIDLSISVATCPKCGGEILIGQKAFNCSNYKTEGAPCDFLVWRNIGGHPVSLDEIRQLCANGCTASAVELYREDGTISHRQLVLSPDKNQILKV